MLQVRLKASPHPMRQDGAASTDSANRFTGEPKVMNWKLKEVDRRRLPGSASQRQRRRDLTKGETAHPSSESMMEPDRLIRPHLFLMVSLLEAQESVTQTAN